MTQGQLGQEAAPSFTAGCRALRQGRHAWPVQRWKWCGVAGSLFDSIRSPGPHQTSTGPIAIFRSEKSRVPRYGSDVLLITEPESSGPEMSPLRSHGGPRPGAGRKPGSGVFKEPTQPIRVPVSQVPAVAAFLDAWREQAALEDDGVRTQDWRRTVPGARVFVPVMGYRVPAGVPSQSDDYVEETVDLNAHLIRKGHEAATFIVRASGWSMFGAGIQDGDEVVVDRALEPRDGSVVVAALNGELVIKRLRIRGGKPVLVSENPHYPERVVGPNETLEIWGVATRVLHKL